jgi:hypothetical protein
VCAFKAKSAALFLLSVERNLDFRNPMKSIVLPAVSTLVAQAASQVAAAGKETPTNQSSAFDPNEVSISKSLGVIILAVAIPFIANFVSKYGQNHPFAHRIIWAVAFIVNLITVNLPGRFDSLKKDGRVTPPWNTFFEPSGWAFSIWAVIYLGEFLLTLYATFVGAPQETFRKAVPFWFAGNLFQSLWCLSFRPSFTKILWLPAFFLFSSCLSFLGTHNVFSTALKTLLDPSSSTAVHRNEILIMLLSRVPLALHAAWLAGATLLNLNGYAGLQQASQSILIAMGFTSVFILATVGFVGSYITEDPFVGAVASWALSALADRSFLKAQQTNPSEIAVKDVHLALVTVEKLLAILLNLFLVILFGKLIIQRKFI